MAAPPPPADYTLRVFRGGSHASGQDVVTDASQTTVLYHVAAEFTSETATTTSLLLRKGAADGPTLCTLDAPPDQPMTIRFPTGWQTTLEKKGLLQKQHEFTGFDGARYAWRKGGTAFVAMASDCVSLRTHKVVAKYRKNVYKLGSDPAEFTLSAELAQQIDLFVATALGVEDEERAAKGM